jgi:hypothetical protein
MLGPSGSAPRESTVNIQGSEPPPDRYNSLRDFVRGAVKASAPECDQILVPEALPVTWSASAAQLALERFGLSSVDIGASTIIGKSFTISSILVSKWSVEAALPTIPPRRLATHWQPATQDEIREATKNRDQSGSGPPADLHN